MVDDLIVSSSSFVHALAPLGHQRCDLVLSGGEPGHVNIEDLIVVGDSVWDLLVARRARA